MPKVNFSKAENAFDKALKQLSIDHLSELATIASAIKEQVNLSSKSIEDIIKRFQKELKKLKQHDRKLYEKLNLTEEEELRFMLSPNQFIQEDWLHLKKLKERIDALKRELYGEEVINAEYDSQVSKERKKHINKRLNIRDGWLPLR